MMFDDRIYELSQLYIKDRHARAERDYLLATCGRPSPSLSACAAWSGRALVRLGHRLERIGGAACGSPAPEMRVRTLSRA